MQLDQNEVTQVVTMHSQSVVLAVDTTFFSRQHGLMVFREPNRKKNVWWKEVSGEKMEIYQQGKEHGDSKDIANNGRTNIHRSTYRMV